MMFQPCNPNAGRLMLFQLASPEAQSEAKEDPARLMMFQPCTPKAGRLMLFQLATPEESKKT